MVNIHIDIDLQHFYNNKYLTVKIHYIRTKYFNRRTISKERRICVESVQ